MLSVSLTRKVSLFQCQITAATAARTKATLPWRVALEVLQTFRQAFFLPLLVTLVPHVVVIRGGDSLNICFNTVAVLFLLQVDNQLYEYGLKRSKPRSKSLVGSTSNRAR